MHDLILADMAGRCNFAPVAPIQILEALQEKGVLGRYHLFLAHHCLEEAERFKALASKMESGIIIMDNSIVELGSSLTVEHMIGAIRPLLEGGYKGQIIPVLPDVMNDGVETRKLIRYYYGPWRQALNEAFPEHIEQLPQLMGVAQGPTSELSLQTAQWLHQASLACKAYQPRGAKFSYVIGVPRALVATQGTRYHTVARIWHEFDNRPAMHLLGFSDDGKDDLLCSKMPGVLGIDSAVPLRLKHTYRPMEVVGPRDPTWFSLGKCTDDTLEGLEAARDHFEVRSKGSW